MLVHCAQGKSRSATLAASFLMLRLRLPASEAVEMVRKGRKMADPNPGLRKELERIGKEMSSQNMGL